MIESGAYITARVNSALARLGSGWVSWIDAVRMPASAYPPSEASHFPDPITALIDKERRDHFLSEGVHYESEYALVLQYTPPMRRNSKVVDLIYDDTPATEEKPATRILAQFRRALDDLEDTLGDAVKLRRMLGYTVTDRAGRDHLQDELVNYRRCKV